MSGIVIAAYDEFLVIPYDQTFATSRVEDGKWQARVSAKTFTRRFGPVYDTEDEAKAAARAAAVALARGTGEVFGEDEPQKLPRDLLMEKALDVAVGSRGTVRQHLKLILLGVIEKEDGFDGKRPFGFSGWRRELEGALADAGFDFLLNDLVEYVFEGRS